MYVEHAYISRFLSDLSQNLSNLGTTSLDESGGLSAHKSPSVKLLRNPVRASGSNQLNVRRLGNPAALSGHWF